MQILGEEVGAAYERAIASADVDVHDACLGVLASAVLLLMRAGHTEEEIGEAVSQLVRDVRAKASTFGVLSTMSPASRPKDEIN